jgi:cytochrome c553
LQRAGTLIGKYRCAVGHGADLAGRDNIPRIAGQHEDSLVKTKREYKSNTRFGRVARLGIAACQRRGNHLAYDAARRP